MRAIQVTVSAPGSGPPVEHASDRHKRATRAQSGPAAVASEITALTSTCTSTGCSGDPSSHSWEARPSR